MKLQLPIASLVEVEMLADALESAARNHRAAAIGAAEALEADRADGEAIAAGAAELVLATLARAGVLERLSNAARTAHSNAAAAAAVPPPAAAVTPMAHPVAAAPVFVAPTPSAPPTAPVPAGLDPEDEPVDIFGPGAIL